MCIAAAIAGSAVVGGAVASKSASKAARAQKDAANTASQTELQMFEQNREDMQPWREAGTVALGQLGAGTAAGGDFNRDFTLGDFQRDPGYQFRMDEGQQALERSAAARGGLLNGGTLKALTQYGQGFASNEFGNAYNRFNADRDRRFNRISSLAGIGQTATRDVAQMGQQTAQNMAGNQLMAGNARASGYVGQGNAISGGLNTLGSLYGMGAFRQPQQANMGASWASAPGWGSGNAFGNGDLGFEFSDRRLKTDITPIGSRPDGLSAYRFRYAGSDKVRTGLMADEVQAIYPDAVQEGPGGFLMVDYRKV